MSKAPADWISLPAVILVQLDEGVLVVVDDLRTMEEMVAVPVSHAFLHDTNAQETLVRSTELRDGTLEVRPRAPFAVSNALENEVAGDHRRAEFLQEHFQSVQGRHDVAQVRRNYFDSDDPVSCLDVCRGAEAPFPDVLNDDGPKAHSQVLRSVRCG